MQQAGPSAQANQPWRVDSMGGLEASPSVRAVGRLVRGDARLRSRRESTPLATGMTRLVTHAKFRGLVKSCSGQQNQIILGC